MIVPALNEAGGIARAIGRAAAADPWQIIVADGGSADATADAARACGALVIEAPRGRGRQLNRGAAAATGDVLLFLHADTLLPAGYDQQVHRALARGGASAGAFGLRIDGPGRSVRAIERAVNWRSRALGLPYGDQAIFVEAATFRRAGGFPDTAAMEDFELVRRLRRLGRIVIADDFVVTSGRRWLSRGAWRTTLLNQWCIAAYLAGASGDAIARWRGNGIGPRRRGN